MINYKTDVKPLIDGGLTIAGSLASRLTGAPGVVASLVVASLRFASDLAAQGIDPVTHIERIHAADPALADVEGVWAEELRKKFG